MNFTLFDILKEHICNLSNLAITLTACFLNAAMNVMTVVMGTVTFECTFETHNMEAGIQMHSLFQNIHVDRLTYKVKQTINAFILQL